MPEQCELLSLDSCQKSLLWAQKEDNPAPHQPTGLVLQVGDAQTFPKARGLKSLLLILSISRQSPHLTAIDEDRDDKIFEQLELACKADGVASPDPVHKFYHQ